CTPRATRVSTPGLPAGYRSPSIATGIRCARAGAPPSRPWSFHGPLPARPPTPGWRATACATKSSFVYGLDLHRVLPGQGTHGGAALFRHDGVGPVLKHYPSQRFVDRRLRWRDRFEPRRAPAVRGSLGVPFARRRFFERFGELFAVALDDIGVGPPLEYAQPGIELARRAFVQCLHEGARGRLGPVSREHRFLEVVTGRLVVLDAIL